MFGKKKKKNKEYQTPFVDWSFHDVNGYTDKEKEGYAKKGIDIRPWGFFQDLSHTPKWHLKTIHVREGAILSLQKHQKREERWFVVEGAIVAERWIGDYKDESIVKVGEQYTIPVKCKHRMSAYKGDAVVIEISLGEFDENDIKRYSDKYGRK